MWAGTGPSPPLWLLQKQHLHLELASPTPVYAHMGEIPLGCLLPHCLPAPPSEVLACILSPSAHRKPLSLEPSHLGRCRQDSGGSDIIPHAQDCRLGALPQCALLGWAISPFPETLGRVHPGGGISFLPGTLWGCRAVQPGP